MMNRTFRTFDELVQAVTVKFITLSYSSASIKKYSGVWGEIGHYMENQGIQIYSAGVGRQFLLEMVGNAEQKTLPRSKRDLIRGVMVLSDFLEIGAIRKCKNRVAPIVLDGPIGKVIADYVVHTARILSLAGATTRSYYTYLAVFFSYLNQAGIRSFRKFNGKLIIDFVNGLTAYSPTTRHLIILKVNQLLAYLHERQFVSSDLSRIAKGHYVRQSKLPSFYSSGEIDQILRCIDRSNACGKRDYAMLLLVARLGMRSSDVVGLKFENILWEKELISFHQQKTKHLTELPLFPEVGDAIIDYLKDGRPKSDLSLVFLRLIAPYDNLDQAGLNGMMKKYLSRAGIRYDERQHGPHSLRHSLATTLLKEEITLPVISGILGHTRTESTMNYLRIDMASLRKCALDVPPVNRNTQQERRDAK